MIQIKFLIFSAAQRTSRSILITQILELQVLVTVMRKYRTHLAAQLAKVQVLLLTSFQGIFFIVQLAPNESFLVLHRVFQKCPPVTSIFHVEAPEMTYFSTMLCTAFSYSPSVLPAHSGKEQRKLFSAH